MGKIQKQSVVEISALKPYPNNAKIHTQEQIDKIADSIKEFGFLSPCLIDSDMNVIAGHGRIEAAKILGMKEVPCVFIEGLTETQRKGNGRGRPRVMTEVKLQELKVYFSEGLDDKEACLLAEISTSTLYNYCNENPDFLELKETLKRKPRIQSKHIVNQVLFEKGKQCSIPKERIDTARWYLEHRANDEFSKSQKIDVEGEMDIRDSRKAAFDACMEELKAAWND